MTCSKGLQVELEPWAAAARTKPLHKGYTLATEQLGCYLNALQQMNRAEQKTMYDTVYVISGHIC